jgi:hypothetical protein
MAPDFSINDVISILNIELAVVQSVEALCDTSRKVVDSIPVGVIERFD